MKLLLFFFSLCQALSGFAAPAAPSDHEIMQLLKQNGIRLETGRAIFYFEDENVDRNKAGDFMADVTKGIEAIEAFTGKKFDAQHYGTEKIEYYISQHTTVSHVYNGYQHNVGKAVPAVFFSAKRFANNGLPYLHETTHLILRDFHSLWLREGIAEWVAMRVAKTLGKGHVAFYGSSNHHDAHQLSAGISHHESKDIILNTVGMDGIPLFKNAEVRRMFYIASTSFVDYLSALLTKERLLGLYEAANTRAVLEQLLGKRMDDIKADWRQCIEGSIAISGE